MKNKWRILKILVTLILFGFLLSFSLTRFNNGNMEKISIHMIQGKKNVYFVDEKEIKELVFKNNPTKKIGDISIPELEKNINQIPFVDSANVFLNLNGNLNIEIKQRFPIFRLKKSDKEFYVDDNGVEFPISKNFSLPIMLVMGDVKPSEYKKLSELVEKIDQDDFCQKYFIGISKQKDNYNLLTSNGNYKVEIGDLENIDFKVKGFKTFVEKYLIDQNTNKYKKISLKYNNQIVTTLNPRYKENDSVLRNAPKIVLKKQVVTNNQKATPVSVKKEIKEKKLEPKRPIKKTEPKEVIVKPKKAVKQEPSKNKISSPKTNDKKKK